MRKRRNRPFLVKLQSALEVGGRRNARKDLREMSCSQMRRFKVETADLWLRRRLDFARWNRRETAPMVEVASSRFSTEVTWGNAAAARQPASSTHTTETPPGHCGPHRQAAQDNCAPDTSSGSFICHFSGRSSRPPTLTSTNRDWVMGKGETKPSSSAKRPSLGFRRDWQRQSCKRLVLRVFGAKRKRPAVVEFTAGRG